MSNLPIGVFDSGIGGLSTLAVCMRLMPREDFIYFADTKNAPYGTKTDEQIRERVFDCSQRLVGEGVKAILVACNTATNAGIAELRRKFNCPFVGLEPAIKPACEATGNGKIVLLCTEATARQQKLKDLLAKYNTFDIAVLPQSSLASLIEKNIENLDRIKDRVHKILEPYIDIDALVLGCTHYVFIKEMIDEFYGGKVKIFDGNEGAAKRLKSILESEGIAADRAQEGTVRFI